MLMTHHDHTPQQSLPVCVMCLPPSHALVQVFPGLLDNCPSIWHCLMWKAVDGCAMLLADLRGHYHWRSTGERHFWRTEEASDHW